MLSQCTHCPGVLVCFFVGIASVCIATSPLDRYVANVARLHVLFEAEGFPHLLEDPMPLLRSFPVGPSLVQSGHNSSNFPVQVLWNPMLTLHTREGNAIAPIQSMNLAFTRNHLIITLPNFPTEMEVSSDTDTILEAFQYERSLQDRFYFYPSSRTLSFFLPGWISMYDIDSSSKPLEQLIKLSDFQEKERKNHINDQTAIRLRRAMDSRYRRLKAKALYEQEIVLHECQKLAGIIPIDAIPKRASVRMVDLALKRGRAAKKRLRDQARAAALAGKHNSLSSSVPTPAEPSSSESPDVRPSKALDRHGPSSPMIPTVGPTEPSSSKSPDLGPSKTFQTGAMLLSNFPLNHEHQSDFIEPSSPIDLPPHIQSG